MLLQIIFFLIEALRLILRHSRGTSSQFYKESLHSQTMF